MAAAIKAAPRKTASGVERVTDLRVDPVLDQFGVVGGFRERGEVSAERRCTGDGNGGRDDQNKRTGVTPSRRAGSGMQDREHKQAREEQELPGDPASPAFKKSSHRIGAVVLKK